MANKLHELELREVSLVDAPANSSVDPETGKKVPRARVALFKRDGEKGGDPETFESFTKEEMDSFEEAIFKDGKTYGGVTYPVSDFAYVPDKDKPSTWKLRLTKTPGGAPDAGIVGAAVAALGKGFRGKRVIIPSADLAAVKAKVRAAWQKANPDRGGEELPDVLKGATQNVTIQELEQKVTKQDGLLATLTAERDFAKSERELVIKMSKKQRKAYASMSEDEQKAFMAGDAAKRKSMCDAAMSKMKEKALEDSMDEATKAAFAKAGPSERIAMLAAQIKKVSDAEGASNEDMMDKKKKAKALKAALQKGDAAEVVRLMKSGAQTEDDEDDDEDEDGDNDLELKRKLAKAEDNVAKLSEKVTDIQKRERLTHFEKRAETELPNTPGTSVEKAADLMAMADAMTGGENGEMFKRYMSNLVAADKALSGHFSEVGKSGGGGPIPAEKIFFAKVEEIRKSDPKLDEAHAVDKVMQEHPQLYLDYERGHNARIAARQL